MASRYWVGGTASWNGTATGKWSTTSGGASGAAEPTASDDVFFDAASGSGTCTIASSTRVCKSLTTTGYTGTIAGSVALNIGTTTSGGLTIGSGTTWSYTGTLSIISTSTHTITTNGKTLNNLTVNGNGVSVTLGDALTVTGTITLTQGTLNTNGKTVAADTLMSSNTNTRALTLGASSITLSGNNVFPLDVAGANLTLTPGTSIITISGSNPVIGFGGYTFYEVRITGVGAASVTSGSFTNFTRTGTAGVDDSLQKSDAAAVTITVSGTLTLAGNSTKNRLLIDNFYRGSSAFNIVCNGTFTASYADFRYITYSGSASGNISAATGGSGNCGGNSGLTFTTPVNQYYYRNNGNYSTSANWFLATNGGGGAGRIPLPQDTGFLDANSFSTGSQTFTIDMPRIGGLIFTGATNSPVLAYSANVFVFGSLTLISGMSLSGGGVGLYFCGTSSTLTSAGKTFPDGVYFYDGSYTLQDAFAGASVVVINGGSVTSAFSITAVPFLVSDEYNTSTLTLSGSGNISSSGGDVTLFGGTISGSSNTLTVTGGTITFGDSSYSGNSYSLGGVTCDSAITHAAGTITIGSSGLSAPTFDSSNSNTRTINMGSGTWAITSSGTCWTTATTTGLTINPSTSIVDFTYSGSSSRTITCGSIRMGSVKISAGTGTVTTTNFFSTGLDFTGFTGTWAGSTAANISGSIKLVSGLTRSFTGTMTLTSTGSANITSAGKTFATGLWTINGSGGTFTLQDNWSSSAGLTITAGTLTGTATITSAALAVNGGTLSNTGTVSCSTLAVGGGTFTLGGNLTCSSTLTVTSGTLTVGANTVSCTTVSITGSTSRTINMGSSTWTVTSSATCWDATTTTNLSLNPQTATVNFSYSGASARTIQGGSANLGNFYVSAGTGNVTTTNLTCNNFDLTGLGSGGWLGSTAMVVNGSFTLVSGVTRTFNGTITFAATTSVTITCDTKTLGNVVFNGSGGTFALADAFSVGTSTWTAGTINAANTITASSFVVQGATVNLGGNVTLSAGLSVTSGTLSGSSYTVTGATTLNNSGGTLTLLGMSGSGALTITAGTTTMGASGVTAASLSSTTGTRTINMGSGTWRMTGTGTVWNIGTTASLTLSAGTSTIEIADTSASTKTFAGAGQTYANFNIIGGGSGSVTLTGSNTFGTFTIGAPKTVIFTAGTTTTVTAFVAVGTAGNVITIQSSSAGSAANLSQASGTVNSDYLSLKDSAATGGATWNAGANSTNVSGNSGWIFSGGFKPAWAANCNQLLDAA